MTRHCADDQSKVPIELLTVRGEQSVALISGSTSDVAHQRFQANQELGVTTQSRYVRRCLVEFILLVCFRPKANEEFSNVPVTFQSRAVERVISKVPMRFDARAY